MNTTKIHQQLPTNWNEREKLREKGQFWTPSWIAEAMVAYVAKGSIEIFDPATGRGVFLNALFHLKFHDKKFYGIDIDSEVLQDVIYKNPIADVEQRDFIKNPPQKKFKAIVANPPYIRHHRIDKQTKLYLRQLCVKIMGHTIDGRAGYHVYFLLQALHHLEKGGRLAFIMSADTCEGTFAQKLWKWITENFCLECVVAFDEKATPFPNVDTNALIFFIKNSTPQKNFFWVKSFLPYSTDLREFVASNFNKQHFSSLEIVGRDLSEALKTGLSRSPHNQLPSQYHLLDFATVMRGIATGANEFFFLTKKQIHALNLPEEYFITAVGRTKDVTGNILRKEDIKELEKKERPTQLLALNGQKNLPKSIVDYIRRGEESGLLNRPLIKQRTPWYKMEQRKVPPLLFAYLGRRNSRFVKNEAGVVPLTGFLCVYPLYEDEIYVHNLWQALNHSDTIRNLHLVGKSYGSGAIKVEPKNLTLLPIPDHIVRRFHLKRQYQTVKGQFDLFREQKKSYNATHKPVGNKKKKL
ncbi:MAG: N-6 DNA methylase [Bacteroidota bacterium]|nr:N-6 DNA methylase [Bacteroidota bacterium]